MDQAYNVVLLVDTKSLLYKAVTALVSLNGFQDLVLHAEEGTKVLPLCIQPVSICMHLCILPCTFHPHPLHPHGCVRAVFIMPWPVYHVLLTTAVNTH